MQKLEKGMACKNHHQKVRHFLFQTKKFPFFYTWLHCSIPVLEYS